jgi:hypothetical protein
LLLIVLFYAELGDFQGNHPKSRRYLSVFPVESLNLAYSAAFRCDVKWNGTLTIVARLLRVAGGLALPALLVGQNDYFCALDLSCCDYTGAKRRKHDLSGALVIYGKFERRKKPGPGNPGRGCFNIPRQREGGRAEVEGFTF